MLIAPDSIRVAPHWALAAFAPKTRKNREHQISKNPVVVVSVFVVFVCFCVCLFVFRIKVVGGMHRLCDA